MEQDDDVRKVGHVNLTHLNITLLFQLINLAKKARKKIIFQAF